jgi:hypothetical protein
MKRPLVIFGLILSASATGYSILGVIMAYWVAAVPGNSPNRIRLNFLVWVPATVIFAATSVLLVAVLANSGNRK